MSIVTGKEFKFTYICRTILKGALAVLLVLALSTLRPAVSLAAITATVLTYGSSASDPPYTTASITPKPNALILAFINNHEPDSPGLPFLSGNGLTWVQVTTSLWKGLTTPDDRITVFRAMGASPTPGSVRITFPLGPSIEHNCLWTIVQFEGVPMTGENGSGAVVQAVTKALESGTSMSIDLASFGRTGNAAVGVFGIDSDKGITPGTGFDSGPVITQGGPNRNQRVEWRLSGSTIDANPVNAAFGENKPSGGIALEVGEGPTVTLGNGTDPGGATIPPGGAPTMADAFTLQTNFGSVTLTDLTVTLPTGSAEAIGTIEITDEAGSSPPLGSLSNFASDTPTIPLSSPITVTTAQMSYKIRITPKSHLNMPVPPGSTYTVTAHVSKMTGGNSYVYLDSGGTTVTIDNLSPGQVTAASLTSSLAQASLTWTSPADADVGSFLVLRAPGAAVTGTPTEGAIYTLGNSVGNGVVACVVAKPMTSCTDNGSASGTEVIYETTYYYKIFTRDTSGNYSSGGVNVLAGFVPHNYRPDAMIKVSTQGDTAYLTPNTYEMPASSQTVPQGVLSGSAAEYTVRFRNNGSTTDSIRITGTPSASNFIVHYQDESSVDRTASVTTGGATIAGLPVGGYKDWTVMVTPVGGISAVKGGASYNVSVTATSVTDNTKVDQVTAATTSTSPNVTLVQNTDRATCRPGEDITYVTTATNGTGLNSAKAVVVSNAVPADTGFKIGGATFIPGSSGLSCAISYSNGSYGYVPSSGGCGAPSGYDYCVTEVKWTMTGSMPAGTSFTCNLVVGVK